MYTAMKSEINVHNLHVRDYISITLGRNFHTSEISGGNVLHMEDNLNPKKVLNCEAKGILKIRGQFNGDETGFVTVTAS